MYEISIERRVSVLRNATRTGSRTFHGWHRSEVNFLGYSAKGTFTVDDLAV